MNKGEISHGALTCRGTVQEMMFKSGLNVSAVSNRALGDKPANEDGMPSGRAIPRLWSHAGRAATAHIQGIEGESTLAASYKEYLRLSAVKADDRRGQQQRPQQVKGTGRPVE
mmetsp:Transcript_8301/g.20258  ORF Transcript_8301/g.20258 Transcript_8301/m.20258 type:complete len:113 (+) Transcript_8301:134-472(+)